MAIKTNTRDVVNLWENIKNISGIGWIVPDTLLWLAETLENRIVLDATTAQFFENIEKGLDIDQQISGLQTKITDDTKKIKRPTSLPSLLRVWPRNFDISTWDVFSLVNTITSLETAEQDKVALNNAIEDNSDVIRNNKGKDKTQVDARNEAANNKQIINYDIRETDRIIPLLRELKELQNFKKNYWSILDSRQKEFKDIKKLVYNFDSSKTFKSVSDPSNPDLNSFKYKDTLWVPIPLKTVFFGSRAPINPEYAICDTETGKKIEYDGGYKLTINWKDVKVKWIKIDGNELKIDGLEIEPIEDVKFPITIKFNIRWSQQSTKSWAYLDFFKPLTINMEAPKMSQSDRIRNYDTYNSTNIIDDRIQAEYDNKRKDRENEFIRELLRTNGNEAEVNKIYENETLRKELIDRIHANPGVTFPVLDIAPLKNEFRNKITDDSDSSKVPLQYLVSDNAFIDYLRNNIAKNVEDFLKKKVKKDVDGNMTLRNNILTTFTGFQTNMENILRDDASVRTTAESTIGLARTNGRRRRDNYMRFMVGKSESLKDQNLKLNDKDHKYSIDLSCETMNKLVANIEVDGQKIALAGRNLKELMRSIINSGRIESNKVAVHVAFGAMKTMIKMMKANNMNIDVRNGAGNLIETKLNDDILTINEVDNTGKRVSKVFDEEHFKNLKDFNTLDIALGQLAWDFHRNMHYYNQDYRRATQYTRVNRLMKYDPRGTRGLRRIRKMWNWKKKNTLDFEFPQTAVTVWDKTANISFEKGKFTVNMWDKEYVTKNIGRMMKKNREFDGMQMEIMAAINSRYVEMLRANPRIAKTNFGVYQPRLGRLYILDSNGWLNYINWGRRLVSGRTQWQWYGKIMTRNMPNSMTPVTSESEIAQFWQNPLLGGRVVKSMMRRLGWI